VHFETGLRGADALHLAIAKNQGAEKILTLDEGLLKAAKLLKVSAARGIR
jgi:predicted nucleic acid-binding protein